MIFYFLPFDLILFVFWSTLRAGVCVEIITSIHPSALHLHSICTPYVVCDSCQLVNGVNVSAPLPAACPSPQFGQFANL